MINNAYSETADEIPFEQLFEWGGHAVDPTITLEVTCRSNRKFETTSISLRIMAHWTEKLFVDNSHLFKDELDKKGHLAEHEVEELFTLVDEEFDHTPSSVLDVGCGLGRHCREFACRESTVTGIDISPEYLAYARERAVEAGLGDRIEYHELDMRELASLDEAFDLVVCLYNTFGYFNDSTNRDVLEGMKNKLTEHGVCVVQTLNKDAILQEFKSQHVRELEFGVVVEQLHFDSETSQMTITRDVLRGDPPELEYDGRAEYTVRLYSPPELKQTFRDAGFTDISLFANYDGESASVDSGRLVAVAR